MNLIDIVEKYDDSFKQLNKRILEIDSGILRYYSKVPQDFNPNNPQMAAIPKAGIQFESITDVLEDDVRVPNMLKQRSIIITFPASLVLQGKETKPKVVKKSEAQMKWIFIFPTPELRQKWAECIASNLQRKPEPTQSIKSYIENYREKIRPDTLFEAQQQIDGEEDKQKTEAKQRQEKLEQLRNNMKIQELSRKQRDDEINKQRKLQAEEEEKKIAIQKAEEERKKREEQNRVVRKEQERQMKQKIQTAWEFRFFQCQEDCLDSSDNFDKNMKMGLKLIKFIETFKEQAFHTVKQYICELIEAQTQIEQNYTAQVNNMIIHIAAPETTERTLVVPYRSHMAKILEKYHECNYFQEQSYFRTLIHSNQQKRKLSDEFHSLNYLNDICYSLRSVDKNFRLKIPLSCILEYLGYKILVIAQPPSNLDETSLAYGQPKNEYYYKTTGKLDREIEALGRTLAIKPHFFSWKQENQNYRKYNMDTRKVGIFLSVNTQIHVGKFDEFEQLKSLLRLYSEEELDVFESRRQGLFYLFQTADIQPFIIEESYSELIETLNQAKTQQNLDFTELPVQEYEFRRSRPEFLSMYFETGVNSQLRMQQNNQNRKFYNPDAYDTNDDTNDIYSDQLALAEMSKHFVKVHIPEFVLKLDQLEICPIDSFTLRWSLKLFGINMKYLGLIAKLTSIPQIQQLCELEMMARSIKNIFNQQFIEYVSTITEDQIPIKGIELTKQSILTYSDNEEDTQKQQFIKQKKYSTINPTRQFMQKQTLSDFLETQYKEMLADLLNLIFSKSTLFYEQILFKQVLYDFDYELNLNVRGLNPGGLLAAIEYNLKVDTEFEPKDIYYGTPYCQQESEGVVQRFNLKPYLHSKTYQQLFKQPLNQVQMSSSISPIPTPPSKGARSIKPKQGIFDVNSIVQQRFDVYSYQCSEAEICKLVNKFNVFKMQRNYQLAIKVLHIRLNLVEGLYHTSNSKYARSSILSDIAEMHLKLHQIPQAIQKIAQAMHEINPQISIPAQNDTFNEAFLSQLLNMNNRVLPKVGMIRPLMILLELVIESQQYQVQNVVFLLFDLIIFNIEFSLGPNHHFYAKVFKLLGVYFQRKGQIEDQQIMIDLEINCLLRNIGHQHQLTAEAYLEIGEQKKTIEEQMIYYEKVYYIFEILYSDTSIQTAYVSLRLTKGYTECGRIIEALKVSAVALKIYKNTKPEEHVLEILELCYLRALNLLRNLQRELSRKECEEYFNTLFVNWDIIAQYETAIDFQQQQTVNDNFVIPPTLFNMTQNTLKVFIELFLTDMQREHRNFLFQMFDMVVETLARSNILEVYDNQCQAQMNYVLAKIKQFGSIQQYMESILTQFIDKTGADANWLIFNFKAQGQDHLRDAYENYENLVIAVGRKNLNKIFDKIFLLSQ